MNVSSALQQHSIYASKQDKRNTLMDAIISERHRRLIEDDGYKHLGFIAHAREMPPQPPVVLSWVEVEGNVSEVRSSVKGCWSPELQTLADAVLREAERLDLDPGLYQFIAQPPTIIAIAAGMFTPEDLLYMDRDLMMYLRQPQCIQAVKNGLFTVQALVDMGFIRAAYITRPVCINALMAEEITLERLKEMSLDDLAQAVQTKQFPRSCGLGQQG